MGLNRRLAIIGSNDSVSEIEKDIGATDEAGSVPAPSTTTAGTKEQQWSFLESGRRNLSEDEISSPAARRFLIAEMERLNSQIFDLRITEKKYNDLRVQLEGLKGASSNSKRNEILSFICLSVGSMIFGAIPSFIIVKAFSGVSTVFIAAAVILVVGGIAARVIK